MRRMFGTGEAIETSNLVYGYILASPISRTTKCLQKGRGQIPGAEFINFFKTPYVNLERVKLETSDSVHGQIYASPFLSMTKYPQKGRTQGPVTEN